MRRLFYGMVVAAIAVLVPLGALAGNQEEANRIAAALRDSGKLHGFNVGVKFQDGTVWLKGQVANPDQIQAAMEFVSAQSGVTRVVNNLSVAGAEKPASEIVKNEPAAPIVREMAPKRADRLVTTFMPTSEPQIETTALQEPTLAPGKLDVAPAKAPVEAPAPKAKPMPLSYAPAPLPMASANGRPAAPPPMAAIPTGAAPARYDQPNMPNYSWPSYAAYPNYAAVTYPKQYSPTAWPYIGPFYPYPPSSARMEEGYPGMARWLVEPRL